MLFSEARIFRARPYLLQRGFKYITQDDGRMVNGGKRRNTAG
jgi:hypothetical protein